MTKSQQLDLSKLQLPSDRFQLGQIRQRHPDCFDSYRHSSACSVTDLDISGVIATEILLATHAFAAATGDTGSLKPMSRAERRDEILNLNVDYRAYGISTGVAQTTELVRNLERSAAAQASRRQR